MSTQELIENRISVLKPEYIELVYSTEIEDIVRVYAEEFNFNEDKQDILLNGLILWLLVFFNDEELADFISSECELPMPVATELAIVLRKSLGDFLVNTQRAAYAVINNESNPTDDEIAKLEAELTAVEKSQVSTPPTTPDPRSTPPPTLHDLRTMQGDMRAHTPPTESEQTHQSSQDQLLGQNNDSSTPRWGSEN